MVPHFLQLEPWMVDQDQWWRFTVTLGDRTEHGLGRTPEVAAQVCFAKWRDILATKDFRFKVETPFGWPVPRG